MSATKINEILGKSAELTSVERRELIRLLHDQELEKQAEERAKRPKTKVNSNYVPSPNTIWMKENSHKYRGLYVALYEGELIATGRTIKEADLAAKAKGFPKTMLTKVFREDEEIWGGW